MRRRFYLVLALLAGAFLTQPARAAETVQVRGAEHEQGFARIAVEWPKPVAFEAKLDGTTLTIHFARPFTASLTPLSHALDSYVASIGQSADGMSIVAKLKKPVELKTATVNGTIAAIDLIARSVAIEKPAAKTPAAAPKAPPAPKPEPIFSAARNQSPEEMVAAPAVAGAAAPGASPPSTGAPVQLFAPTASDTSATPAIPIPPAAAPPPQAPAPASPQASTPTPAQLQAQSPGAHASEKVQVRGAEHPEGYARIAVEWPKPVDFEAKLDGATLTIHFARPFTATLTPLAHQLDHYVASVAQSADGASIVVQLKQPAEIKTRTVDGKIASVD